MITLYADQIHGSPYQGIMHKAGLKGVTRVTINLLAEYSRAVVPFRGLKLPSMQPHLYTYLSSPAQYTIKGNA